MKIALISPYHGGSHHAWAEGFRQRSTHEVAFFTLPARFWKWRMHGGAVTLARQFLREAARPNLLLATDMLDLTTFLALTRPHAGRLPVVLYMHENQLTYPLPAEGDGGPMRRQQGERDLHYAFINYASMLAADCVLFNSHFHRRSFFDALPNFLKHFPEYNELETVEETAAKSRVLPAGVDAERLLRPEGLTPVSSVGAEHPPLIIWNQRWEYDKNPAAFFRALYTVAAEGIPFRLALCGESFRQQPAEFEEAQERLAKQIVHVGYAEPERYRSLLWEAEVTVSTAIHEFFGISILEAVTCHTLPILPRRLSYPELLPEAFHRRLLYEDEDGLLQRLRWALTEREKARAAAAVLAPKMAAFAWREVAARYDALLGRIVEDAS